MDAFPGDLIYITVFCTLGSPVSGPEQVVSALLDGSIWPWTGYLRESCVTNIL
jgi:hypothetical protein